MSQPQEDVRKAKMTALFPSSAHANSLSLLPTPLHTAGQDLFPQVHPKNVEDF